MTGIWCCVSPYWRKWSTGIKGSHAEKKRRHWRSGRGGVYPRRKWHIRYDRGVVDNFDSVSADFVTFQRFVIVEVEMAMRQGGKYADVFQLSFSESSAIGFTCFWHRRGPYENCISRSSSELLESASSYRWLVVERCSILFELTQGCLCFHSSVQNDGISRAVQGGFCFLMRSRQNRYAVLHSLHVSTVTALYSAIAASNDIVERDLLVLWALSTLLIVCIGMGLGIVESNQCGWCSILSPEGLASFAKNRMNPRVALFLVFRWWSFSFRIDITRISGT